PMTRRNFITLLVTRIIERRAEASSLRRCVVLRSNAGPIVLVLVLVLEQATKRISGLLECWSNDRPCSALHYSITPPLRRAVGSRTTTRTRTMARVWITHPFSPQLSGSTASINRSGLRGGKSCLP